MANTTHNPNLPSGRQEYPHVASANDISKQKQIAAGGKICGTTEEEVMTPENTNTENQEMETTTMQQNEHVETQHLEVEEEQVESTEAEYSQHDLEQMAEAEEAVDYNDGEMTDADVEAELEAELDEDEADWEDEDEDDFEFATGDAVTDSILGSALEFHTIANTLVITMPITTADRLRYCEDEEVVRMLQVVPELDVANPDEVSLENVLNNELDYVETDSTFDAYHPLSESGWLRKSLTPVFSFVNTFAQNVVPIFVASEDRLEVSTHIAMSIEDNVHNVLNGAVISTASGFSGYVEETEEGTSLQFGLDEFFSVSSYVNDSADNSSNIVTNMQIVNPKLLASSKPGAFVEKLNTFFTKAVAKQGVEVPVFLNYAFRTSDFINDLRIRDTLDKLIDMGYTSISRTEVLESIGDEFAVLPEQLDIVSVADIDSLFGEADVILTSCLNSEDENSEEF